MTTPNGRTLIGSGSSMTAGCSASVAGRKVENAAPYIRADIALAASRSRPAEAKAVKALEWTRPLPSDRTLSRAKTVVGTYRTWTHHEADGKWFWELASFSVTSGEGATEHEVQAAAQQDFEARIRSALE